MNPYIPPVSIKGQTAEEAIEQGGGDGGKLLLKLWRSKTAIKEGGRISQLLANVLKPPVIQRSCWRSASVLVSEQLLLTSVLGKQNQTDTQPLRDSRRRSVNSNKNCLIKSELCKLILVNYCNFNVIRGIIGKCCILNMFMLSFKQLYVYLILCLHACTDGGRRDSGGLAKYASLEHWYSAWCGGGEERELYFPGNFPHRLLRRPGV